MDKEGERRREQWESARRSMRRELRRWRRGRDVEKEHLEKGARKGSSNMEREKGTKSRRDDWFDEQ